MIFSFNLQFQTDENYADIPLAPSQDHPIPFRAFISLARAGNMHFQKRETLPYRKMLLQEIGKDPALVFGLIQKHTRDVVVINEKSEPALWSGIIADGLVTAGSKPLLTVTVADCLPIFIVDLETLGFGVVHSGWKGTGIVMNAVALMERELGSERKNIRVIIGPGIGACCYSVERTRAELFMRTYGEDTVKQSRGDYFLDLKQANINLLAKEGIHEIMVASDCTSCNPLLSSYRREAKPDFNAMLAGIYRV